MFNRLDDCRAKICVSDLPDQTACDCTTVKLDMIIFSVMSPIILIILLIFLFGHICNNHHGWDRHINSTHCDILYWGWCCICFPSCLHKALSPNSIRLIYIISGLFTISQVTYWIIYYNTKVDANYFTTWISVLVWETIGSLLAVLVASTLWFVCICIINIFKLCVHTEIEHHNETVVEAVV